MRHGICPPNCLLGLGTQPPRWGACGGLGQHATPGPRRRCTVSAAHPGARALPKEVRSNTASTPAPHGKGPTSPNIRLVTHATRHRACSRVQCFSPSGDGRRAKKRAEPGPPQGPIAAAGMMLWGMVLGQGPSGADRNPPAGRLRLGLGACASGHTSFPPPPPPAQGGGDSAGPRTPTTPAPPPGAFGQQLVANGVALRRPWEPKAPDAP